MYIHIYIIYPFTWEYYIYIRKIVLTYLLLIVFQKHSQLLRCHETSIRNHGLKYMYNYGTLSANSYMAIISLCYNVLNEFGRAMPTKIWGWTFENNLSSCVEAHHDWYRRQH